MRLRTITGKLYQGVTEYRKSANKQINKNPKELSGNYSISDLNELLWVQTQDKNSTQDKWRSKIYID